MQIDLNKQKQDAIHQLNKLCSTLNKTQLEIIAKVINRCETIQEVLDVKNLFIQKNKVFGSFDFDADDDNAMLEIALLQKDQNLSYTLNKNKPNNTMIIGDNFDALKNLLITSYKSIDVIYIDPPYNTGGSDLGYKDKFGKDAWLSLMYERLEYAKELLKDDGVIFVSIDDNMQAYLKVIMDEIFGETNFIAVYPRVTIKGGKTQSKFNTSNFDYIICYAKNIESATFTKKDVDETDFIYKDEYFEKRGPFHTKQYLDVNSLGYIKSLDYPIILNNETYYPGSEKEYLERQSNNVSKDNEWRWTWSKNKLNFGLKNDFIVIRNGRIAIKKYLFCQIDEKSDGYKLIYKKRQQPYSNLDFLWNEYSNTNGKYDLDDCGMSGEFSNPKPINLVRNLINLHPNKNAIVLDFFAGSGTTSEAVLELNKKDGGNRKYIVCTIEQDQNLKVADICYERIYRINHGYGTKNEKNYAWLKNHEPYQSNLNVYKIIKENITLDQNNKKIEDFDFLPYKELNPDLDINKTNFLDELYSLTIRNWWLS